MTFKAAWWLRNPHLQTIWPTFCRRSLKNIAVRRERIELPDGDFIDLDWMGSGYGPIVIILHGFEGSVNSPYAKGLMQVITEQGWRAAFMHFRGCSGEPNRLSRSYHSGETTDIAAIVKILHEREKNIPLASCRIFSGRQCFIKMAG